MKAVPVRSLAMLAAGSLLLNGCAPLLSRVETVPANAEISIDGRYAGTGATSLPDRSLNGYGPARAYRVTLEAPSLKTYEATISSRPEPAMYAGAAASLGGAAYFFTQYLRTGKQDNSFEDEINLAGSLAFAALTYLLTFQNHRFEPTYQFDLASRHVTHPSVPGISAPVKADARLQDVVRVYEQIRARYVQKADLRAAEAEAIRALFDGAPMPARPYVERIDPNQPLAAFGQAYLEAARTQPPDVLSLKAMKGMIESLDDSQAAYLPAPALENQADGKSHTHAAQGQDTIAPPFEATALPPGIGHLRLTWLESSLYAKDLERSLEIVSRARGLILDLRGAEGGSPYDVKTIGSMLLDKGPVARLAGAMSDVIPASGKPALSARVPMVVLIDRGTHGAAEVLAGSLQEAGRATLLGEPSFGDTRLLTTIRLANGDRIQLPSLETLTGAGRRIHGTGLTPDIVVTGERTLDAARDLLVNGLTSAEVRRKYEAR